MQGIGVSMEAPGNPFEITPNGVNPPTGSNVISLGSYDGTTTWASGLLYTDQNFKNTSGTKIKLNTNFRYYQSKDDAINRENPLLPTLNIRVYMYKASDSPNGSNLVSSQTVSLNHSTSVTFNVEKNQGYYFQFACNIGNYVSGDFTVTK